MTAARCAEPITLDQLRNALYNISGDSARSDTLRVGDFLRLCIPPQERMADHLRERAKGSHTAPTTSSLCAAQPSADHVRQVLPRNRSAKHKHA